MSSIKLFRAMRQDAAGQPVCELSARGLDVRPGADIPVQDGFVQPRTGGLSVAPDDPQNLAAHRRPASLGGTGKDPVWSIDSDSLGESLICRQDKGDHGLIEPARVMLLDEYNQALSDLAPRWE